MDILPLFLNFQTILPRTTSRQLYRIVLALLAMTGRITQRGIARWTLEGGSYRTLHRFFQTQIDWDAVQCAFVINCLFDKEDPYILVGEETVVQKAGKKTQGKDYFYASLAGKAIPALAFFAFAIVNIKDRIAHPVSTQQVIRSQQEKDNAKQNKQNKQNKAKVNKDQPKRPVGRPKGSKNQNKQTPVLNAELTRILHWTNNLLSLLVQVPLRHFVLEGHFGNQYAYAMVRQTGLHLVSKLCYNSALYFQLTPSQKLAQPKRKYGEKVNYAHLPAEYRVSCEEVEGYRVEIYQALCWHKHFPELLNIVIIKKTNLLTNARGQVVLFSSDLGLSALTLKDYYILRFQIEFVFRSAKQDFGLEDFMGVKEQAVTNAASLSFLMVNVSEYLLGEMRQQIPEAGIPDLKSYFCGRRYVLELLKYLPLSVHRIVCKRVFSGFALLGSIHSSPKSCEIGDFGGEVGWMEADSPLALAA